MCLVINWICSIHLINELLMKIICSLMGNERGGEAGGREGNDGAVPNRLASAGSGSTAEENEAPRRCAH